MTKRCKAAFAASVGGIPRVMRPGALVQDNDPVIKGRENLFEDVDTYVQKRVRRVEDATAEPGGRRSLSRPTKQTAAKPRAAKKTAAKTEDKAEDKAEQAGTEAKDPGTQPSDEGNAEGTGGA